MCGQVEYELGYGVSKRIRENLFQAKLIQVIQEGPPLLQCFTNSNVHLFSVILVPGKIG